LSQHQLPRYADLIVVLIRISVSWDIIPCQMVVTKVSKECSVPFIRLVITFTSRQGKTSQQTCIFTHYLHWENISKKIILYVPFLQQEYLCTLMTFHSFKYMAKHCFLYHHQIKAQNNQNWQQIPGVHAWMLVLPEQ
jgi:predicted RNA methylase